MCVCVRICAIPYLTSFVALNHITLYGGGAVNRHFNDFFLFSLFSSTLAIRVPPRNESINSMQHTQNKTFPNQQITLSIRMQTNCLPPYEHVTLEHCYLPTYPLNAKRWIIWSSLPSLPLTERIEHRW